MRKLGVKSKTTSSNSTVQKQGDHFLARKLTPHRMDSLLTDWVNVRTEKPDKAYNPAMKALIDRSDDEIKRLVTKYSDFFASRPPSQSLWEWVFRVQVFLRLAWDAPDLRQRDWFIHEARREYYSQAILKPIHLDATGGLITSPPPLTPFERVMDRFSRIADRARHCANPECPSRYFFAVKRGQKYCTETCAAPARREQNRRWWRENRGGGKNGGNR
jgi:hypothetical protein